MKFDMVTRQLSTDDGQPIKILHCPFGKRWHELHAAAGVLYRRCGQCEHTVIDTAVLSERDIVALVDLDPSTCLRIREGQGNVTVVRPGNA